ncbi:MAG TPA: 30S ribosomal protein S6 [Acidimicrobiales bacterium]|nr:30S ribosomal protein S6 [Acidimicrobiales bacterium]
MRPYEVMIIFDAGLEEETIRAVLDRATEALTSRGGTVARVDRWGRRRFAYELKHRLEGYYVVVEANAEPAAMAEMDRVLSLADEALRHKVIRVPDSVAGRAPRPAPAPAAPEAQAAAQTEPTGV